jgi:hypothetical protein
MPRRPRMYIEGLPYHIVQRGNNRSVGGNYSSAYTGSLGAGAGMFVSLGAMRTNTWFKKVYSYDEAPGHVWTQ